MRYICLVHADPKRFEQLTREQQQDLDRRSMAYDRELTDTTFERPELTPPLRELALKGIKDDDAFVRRAAAGVLGQHPSAENLRPLLALRQAVPKDDTHLLHVANPGGMAEALDAFVERHPV